MMRGKIGNYSGGVKSNTSEGEPSKRFLTVSERQVQNQKALRKEFKECANDMTSKDMFNAMLSAIEERAVYDCYGEQIEDFSNKVRRIAWKLERGDKI